MKNKTLLLAGLFYLASLLTCNKENAPKPLIIINHECTGLAKIPVTWINKAKSDLHIAFGHTSYGNQLIVGMTGLATWKGDPFLWNNGTLANSLDIRDGIMAGDLGSSGDLTWENTTHSYLDDWRNTDINVVIWAWGGGVSTNTEGGINTYLNTMSKLEQNYPKVKFVYMTGHLDGTGLQGNLNIRNEQIRKYCKDNHKILYDFADIESYDPDGNYFLDKLATDACYYDSNNSGSIDGADRNWAIDWQNSHTQGVDWFTCSPDHTQAINGNMKAYAVWWLCARLAGWDGK